MFRIFLAQQRAASDVAIVTALLQQWLTEPPPGRRPARGGRARAGAADLRPPSSASRRSATWPAAWCSAGSRQPLLRRNRAEVYARVRGHLRYLDEHPDAPDRAERIADDGRAAPSRWSGCSGSARPRRAPTRGPLLEVLSRRYYGNRGLSGVRCYRGRRHGVRHRRVRPGRRASRLVADGRRLRAAWPGRWRPGGAWPPAAGDLVADVYLTWAGQPADADAMAAELREVLAAAALPEQVRRVTMTVAGRRGAAMHHHFTFRPLGRRARRGPADPRPAPAHRAAAAAAAAAATSTCTRLPSADEDVYLFRCVAPQNPADERLVAMAQVRDLTPLRDAEGRLIALPAVEGALDGVPGRDPQGPGAAAGATSGSTPTGSSSTSGRRASSPSRS